MSLSRLQKARCALCALRPRLPVHNPCSVCCLPPGQPTKMPDSLCFCHEEASVAEVVKKNVVKPSTTLIRSEMRLGKLRLPVHIPAWMVVTPSVTKSRLQLARSVGQRESFANEAKV